MSLQQSGGQYLGSGSFSQVYSNPPPGLVYVDNHLKRHEIKKENGRITTDPLNPAFLKYAVKVALPDTVSELDEEAKTLDTLTAQLGLTERDVSELEEAALYPVSKKVYRVNLKLLRERKDIYTDPDWYQSEPGGEEYPIPLQDDGNAYGILIPLGRTDLNSLFDTTFKDVLVTRDCTSPLPKFIPAFNYISYIINIVNIF